MTVPEDNVKMALYDRSRLNWLWAIAQLLWWIEFKGKFWGFL